MARHDRMPTQTPTRALRPTPGAGWGRRARAGGALACGVLAFGAVFAEVAVPTPDTARTIHPGVLRAVLGGGGPDTSLLADPLDFFSERYASRGADDRAALQELVSLHLLRFKAYGADRELAAAESHLERLLTRHPADAALLATRSSIALSRHDFPGAVRAAEDAHRLPGGPAAASEKLFDAYLAVGRLDDAAGLLGDDDPLPSIGRLARTARLRDAYGDVEGARDDMVRVVELTAAYDEPAPVRAWALVELGRFEHHAGRPERAVRAFLDALSLVPASSAALEGLADLAYGVDADLPAAEALYLRSAGGGGHPDVYLKLVEVADARGDTAAAGRYRSAFERAALAGGASTVGLVRRPLALHYAADGRHEEALTLAREDVRDRPTSGSYAVLAWVLHLAGRHEIAAGLFERALDVPSAEPWVVRLAALAAADRRERTVARALLTEALESSAELGPVQTAELQRRLASLE